MEHSNRILVTSCKGGVGKSTVSANLAYALCKRARTVLLVDMDLGNRSLDIMLGLEDAALFDISDVASNRAEPERALIRDEKRQGLVFCPAPYLYDGSMTAKTLDIALSKLEAACGADFTVLDTSGGADCSVTLSAACAGRALIVTTPAPAAVRAAEKSGELLSAAGVKELMLIINSFDCAPELAREHLGINEIIDRTSVRVAGVILRDAGLALDTERGRLAGESGRRKKLSPCAAAFSNIAARLEGESVPLLSGVPGIKKRKKLLLCGRRPI